MIGIVIDDKFKIVSELGAGGAGTVYKAEQRDLKRFVAIKVLHAKKSADLQLIKEAKNLQKVRSPHIVNVIAVGLIDKQQPYLVMEYLEGESLDALIERSDSLSESQTIDIAIQICLALEAAHFENVVHRDLKPANIVLSHVNNTNDSKPIVKVLDFGLAKNLNPGESMAATSTKTGTGNLVGTVAYMSPEVCSGQKADLLSDIYSFGCILYECLSGHPPFQADNWVALLHMHREVAPSSLREANSNLTPEMEMLILKCLEKNPSDRFSSAKEIRTALEMIQSGQIQALATSGILQQGNSRTSSGSGKNYKIMLSLLCVLALLICGVVALREISKRKSAEVPTPAPITQKVEKKALKFRSFSQRVKDLPLIYEKAYGTKLTPSVIPEFDAILAKTKDPTILAVVYQLKANLLNELGKEEETMQLYKLALKNMRIAFNGKDSVESLHALSGVHKCQMALGQWNEAEKSLEQLLPLIKLVETSELQTIPNLAIDDKFHSDLYVWTESPFQTYMSASDLYAAKGEWAKSDSFAIKADKVSYLRPEPYTRLADNAYLRGKPAEANKWLDKLAKRTDEIATEVEEDKKNLQAPGLSEHVTQAANLYAKLGDWLYTHNQYQRARHFYQLAILMAEGSNYYKKFGAITDAHKRLKEIDEILSRGSKN